MSSSLRTEDIRGPIPLDSARRGAPAPSSELAEEKLRLLADAAFDGILGHDYSQVVEVNQSLCAMFGYTREELIGRSVIELVHPDCRATVLQGFQASHRRYECIALHKDGTPFNVEISSADVPRHGEPFRITAIRDITRRRQVEARLMESEENFRILCQVAFDGILLERNGLVEEANECFARMFGYEPADLQNRPIATLLRPDGRTWSEGRIEASGIRADGSTFPVSLCIATASDGRRIHAVRDVTLEKSAQDQLRETERRYRELSETTHDLLCLHDTEGRVLEANTAALRALGYSHEEIRGISIRDVLTPGSAASFDDYLRTILEEGSAEGHMAVLNRRGERRLWHYRNVLQTSGNDVYVRGLAQDVTEQERAAVALQKSEQHFRSIIENISDTITILDASGFVQYQSPSIRDVLGYVVSDAPKAHFADYIHPDDRPAACEFFTAQLNNPGAKETLDARVRHRDGSWRWLSMAATARTTAGGLSLIVNGRDVTERRLLLAQLEQANRVNSLGHLAATVAHEFNNVLMGMQPFAELMQRPSVSPEKIARGSSYILSSIARGKRVALDILRFTQPASPSFATVQLARWWEGLLPELEAGTGNSILLQSSFPDELTAWADANQLAQVLSNLVSNARDAMPGGGTLTVHARQPRAGETFPFGVVAEPERYAQISVSDTGIGMSEEVVTHIFEPLYTTKRNGGTGLGLPVVHQVVSRHKGAIFVTTRPGEGTTFHLFLPAGSTSQTEDPFGPRADGASR